MITEESPLWRFVGLEANWDGHGAKVPSQKMFDLAEEFVAELRYLFTEDQMPHIEPTAKAGFRFSWIGGKNCLLDIELKTGGMHDWSMSLPEGDSFGKASKVGRLVAVAAVFYCKKEEKN